MISIVKFFVLLAAVSLYSSAHQFTSVWDIQKRDPRGSDICISMSNQSGTWRCVKAIKGREATWVSFNHARPRPHLRSFKGVHDEQDDSCPKTVVSTNSFCLLSKRPFMYVIWDSPVCQQMTSVTDGCYEVPAKCVTSDIREVKCSLWVNSNRCETMTIPVDTNYCSRLSFFEKFGSHCDRSYPFVIAAIVLIVALLFLIFFCRVKHVGLLRRSGLKLTDPVIESDERGSDTQTVVTVESVPQQRNNGRVRLWTFGSIIMLLMLHCDASCSNIVGVQGQLLSCEQHGDYEECEMIFSTIFNLRDIGSSACLSVSAENATTIFEVSLSQFSYSFKPEYLYSTGWWQASVLSRRKCTGTSGCPSYYCNYNDDCFIGLTGDNITGGACEHFCEVSGAAPACFTAYACYRSSYSLDSDCMVDVYSLTLQGFKILLEVNSESVIWTGSHVSLPQIEIDVQGSFSGNEVPLPSSASLLCLDRKTGSAYFCDASDRQSPRRGKIGDIQCGSDRKIKDWDRGVMVNRRIHNQDTEMQFAEPGWAVDRTRVELPHDFGNYIAFWDQTNSVIKGVLSHLSAPVAVSAVSGTELTVKRTKALVCPEIVNFSYGGCRYCADGATACVFARSSCYEGSVWVETPYISTSIYLESVEKEYCFPIAGNESEVRIRLSYRDKADEVLFHPELDLKDTLIDFTNTTESISTVLSRKAAEARKNKLWKIVLLILVAVALVILAFSVLSFVIRCKSKRL